jgi:hypothetical protein
MKTAEELGILPKECVALVDVRDYLRAVKPKAPDYYGDTGARHLGPVPVRFDMGLSVARYECGTAFCVGGLVKLRMERGHLPAEVRLTFLEMSEISTYVHDQDEDSPLRKLFYPPVDAWEWITASVAARAITQFLNTGKVDWKKLRGTARAQAK